MASWQFLVVGSLAALGAALAVGTLGALLRYYRTGRFPGEDNPVGGVSTAHLVGLWIRVLVGAALAAWGVVSLVRAGLL